MRRSFVTLTGALLMLAVAASPAWRLPVPRQVGQQRAGPGQFLFAYDLAVNKNTGVQYVADTEQHRIVKFGPDGAALGAWGGLGAGDTQFNQPSGVAVDTEGNVWVADKLNNRIKKFDQNGVFLSAFGQTGTNPGEITGPDDVAVDPAGNFFVTEPNGNRVQRFSPTGAYLTGWNSIDASGLAVNATDVYVTDYNGHRVRRFTPNGTANGEWGMTTSGEGGLEQPWHLGLDDQGNVYVADRSPRIQEFNPAGVFIKAFGWGVATNASQFEVCTAGCWSGIHGSGDGQFDSSSGVDVDCRGNVYVSDQAYARVQKFGELNTAALPCVLPATPDTTPPSVGDTAVSPKKFAVDKSGQAARRKRAPTGTKIAYKLSEPATVGFTVERKTKGRKVGKACKRKTRANRKRRKCTRYSSQGSFTQAGVAGANSKPFSGKIGKRTLKPGSYRLTLIATDAAGNKSKASTANFTIVKR